MITGKSLAKNAGIQTIGKLFSVLIGLGTIAIMTRALGTELFGEYTTTITFLQFFGILVDFGLSLTLLVMISEKDADEAKISGNFLGLRLVTGFLLFGIAPIVVLAFPWSQTIKHAVVFGAISYFLMGGATLLGSVFQKYEAMARASIGEILNRLVLFLGVSLIAWIHLGVVAFVGISIVANLVWLLAMIWFAKPFVRIVPLFDLTVWRQIMGRSWPIALSIVFNLMYLKGDILILSLYRTQAEVGLYGVAYRVVDILTFIPIMFMGLMLPSLTLAWTNGDHEQFRTRLSRTFDLFVIFAVPVVFGAQLVGVKLMEFVAGSGYEQSGEILKILSIALFSVFIGTLFGHLVVALNKQRAMIFGYATAALLTVLGYLYTIPRYGMYGAAWMTVFSEVFIAIVTFVMVYKTAKALPHLGVFFKSVFAALIMSACMIMLPHLHVAFEIFIGSVVYFLAMIFLKGIKRDDLVLFIPSTFKKTV